MKKTLFLRFIPFWILINALVFAGSEPTTVNFQPLSPEPQHRQVSQVVAHLLRETHYQRKALDDALGAETFDRYLEKLDYQRLYFLESDIQSFEQYRYMFDDYIGSGQVQTAYDIFNLYEKRMAERLVHVFALLEGEPFDFTIDETIDIDRENDPWAKTPAELNELWRKRIKNEALNLKLAGKDWAGIRETLTKRYERTKRNVEQFQSEDVFQILMNAFAESYDPHTSYFSPKDFDDFRIQMSQSLEGIGARLTTENDYTIISEIVPGGPADKSKQLHPNDKIIGVGQGLDGEIVDVVGWRIDDVVQLIRGKKGTVVNLQIIEAEALAGAKPRMIAIVRDKIELEDRAAKGDTLEIHHEGKPMRFGVIEIPSFYSDFDGRRRGNNDYKSTTRDVRKLLDGFKSEHIDGVIIDLRRNGGGYLNEAVDLTGLFIKEGPVVQVRNSLGNIDVEEDNDPAVIYDGPIVVLVDRLSASASEIFAAAIQDYHRGIIVGSQTYGKGTVQNALPLQRYIPSYPDKLGQLKLTIAKFYRIDGRSTQHVGVIPDVDFPSRYTLMEIGESSRENALLWDQIRPVPYRELQDFTGILPLIRQRHENRLAGNAEYAKLLHNLDEFKKNRNREIYSLKEAERQKEREAAEADDPDEENPHDTDPDKKKKDLLLTESAHILGDYILLSKID